MLFPSVSVFEHLATMLRRSARGVRSRDKNPVALNVSGHRQYGVFSNENCPVQINGHPAYGWGGITSNSEKAEHTDRCVKNGPD